MDLPRATQEAIKDGPGEEYYEIRDVIEGLLVETLEEVDVEAIDLEASMEAHCGYYKGLLDALDGAESEWSDWV